MARVARIAFAAFLPTLLGCPGRAEVELRRAGEPQPIGVVRIYLFGSGACKACMGEVTPRGFRSVERRIRVDAARRGFRVVLVGVALDNTAAQSAAFLSHTGPFDVVSMGGNWWNETAESIRREFSTEVASVPLLMVVREDPRFMLTDGPPARRLLAIASGSDGISSNALADSILTRLGVSWRGPAQRPPYQAGGS